jgi:soluble lytic murein transglycosylase
MVLTSGFSQPVTPLLLRNRRLSLHNRLLHRRVGVSCVVMLGLVIGLCTPFPDVLAKASLAEQRQLFLRGKEAIHKGDLKTFRSLLPKLEDYVLYPYLEYYSLRKQLSHVRAEDIVAFVERYADSPLAGRLHHVWLEDLAKRKQWSAFLKHYRDYADTTLHCYHLQARLQTGQSEGVLAEIKRLWLHGYSRPKACDRVFDYWRARGEQKPALVWKRIELAMEKGQLRLTRYLARFLDPKGQQWVERWRRMHEQPAQELEQSYYQQDTPRVRTILVHGVKRLARRDADRAERRWQTLKTGHTFSVQQRSEVGRSIALNSALQHLPEATQRLAAISSEWQNASTRQWRVRSAILQGDWKGVLAAIDALQTNERQDGMWRYWRARALGQQRQRASADELYTQLAKERSYHGFLAADQLGLGYCIENKPILATPQELASIEAIPSIARAHELYRLHLISEARREWDSTLKRLNDRELQLAAKVAERWGWRDRAILTVAKSTRRDDLELRFPLAHREPVLSNAHAQDIDPAWVYGVMRQESAFMADAQSRSGALGLMQLMPSTGRYTARLLNIRIGRNQELLEVSKNIRLGTAYLRRVLDLNQGNQLLATAAYNAGPGRVRQWRPRNAQRAADVWAATLPFTETRRYVRRVMAYTTIYSKRLDRQNTPLRQRMRDIEPVE